MHCREIYDKEDSWKKGVGNILNFFQCIVQGTWKFLLVITGSFFLLFMIVALVGFLNGIFRGPGSNYSIQQLKLIFTQNESSICEIRDYTKSLPDKTKLYYEYSEMAEEGPYILSKMSFTKTEVENVTFKDALKQVACSGLTDITGCNEYVQLTAGADLNRSYGLIYFFGESINYEDAYITELYQITEDGWYYYVSDYDDWKAGKRPFNNPELII